MKFLSLFSFKKIALLGFVFLLSLLCALYFKLEAKEEELKKTKQSLEFALNANESLKRANDELVKRHKQELEAVSLANEAKMNIQTRVEYVKQKVFRSDENNITKLFNLMLDGLFEQ